MIATRTYASYEQYIDKQSGKSKSRRDFLLAHLPKNTESFKRTFRKAAPHLKPGSVLCLGARSGAESLGAAAAGFKGSVGIDLHPVGPSVLRGDWHALSFPNDSFDNVFTNCLDHCLYLDKFTAQVQRVLVPTGRFYFMATNRLGVDVDEWKANLGSEALYWQTSDELCAEICVRGFAQVKAWRDGKWGHYVLSVLP